MTRQHKQRVAPRGFSLTELLIVMTIMIMLVAMTLPVARRIIDDGNVREASRQLNAYLAMAKSRALQTGRPCGVMLKCDLPLGITDYTAPASPNPPLWPVRQVTQMYLAEVPPPYSGSAIGAVAKIWDPTGNNGQRYFTPTNTLGTILDSNEPLFLASLIEPGEVFQVRFNFKGEWYQCIRGMGTNTNYGNPTLFYFVGGSATLPPGYSDTPMSSSGAWPYQIVRAPRRIGNPLTLPAGTCVDLALSGVGASGQGFYPSTNLPGLPQIQGLGIFPLNYLTVMLSPEGGLQTVYANNYPLPPASGVHLLVGRTDKVVSPLNPAAVAITNTNPDMFDATKSNIADPGALWVSVAKSTGIVNTSENLPPLADISTLAAGTVTLFPGEATVPSGRRQVLQLTGSSAQQDRATFLHYCRQLATNREQVRGQ